MAAKSSHNIAINYISKYMRLSSLSSLSRNHIHFTDRQHI